MVIRFQEIFFYFIFICSFPLETQSDTIEWKNLNDESDDMNDASRFNDDSVDIATDLVSDEEHVASRGEDEAVIVSNDTSESESDDDVEAQISSINLNDKISLSIDMFKLLKNVFALMKKCRLVVKFMRNHTITNEYINQYMLSNNNGKRTGDLVLDIFIP